VLTLALTLPCCAALCAPSPMAVGRMTELASGACADVQRCLVCIGRTGAVGLQALRNDPQEDAQHHVANRTIPLQKKAQPLWNRQHPLTHWQTGEDEIRQVRRRLHHAPGVARGADDPAFAGEGDKVVVPAVTTACVGEDAALQILLERFAHERLGAVVVALAIELACAGEFIPSLPSSTRNALNA
jgi:hypothetical protein